MIYRFDEEGQGQVFAKQREPHLEAYFGNWYPASDIPQIARRGGPVRVRNQALFRASRPEIRVA
jgi:light-regulated signal transduction histidine kinase (bacteriophytochrome)